MLWASDSWDDRGPCASPLRWLLPLMARSVPLISTKVVSCSIKSSRRDCRWSGFSMKPSSRLFHLYWFCYDFWFSLILIMLLLRQGSIPCSPYRFPVSAPINSSSPDSITQRKVIRKKQCELERDYEWLSVWEKGKSSPGHPLTILVVMSKYLFQFCLSADHNLFTYLIPIMHVLTLIIFCSCEWFWFHDMYLVFTVKLFSGQSVYTIQLRITSVLRIFMCISA